MTQHRSQELARLDDDIALARAQTIVAARDVRRNPRLVFQGLDTIARLQGRPQPAHPGR